jgi:hypothetical protein
MSIFMEKNPRSSILDSIYGYKMFDIDNIYKFPDKFYSHNCMEQGKMHLRIQLQHFELKIPLHPNLKNLLKTN